MKEFHRLGLCPHEPRRGGISKNGYAHNKMLAPECDILVRFKYRGIY